MNYVTTNIRIPEEDYLRLKQEAARTRKSIAALVREKLSSEKVLRSSSEADKILGRIRSLAQKNAKYTKGFDSVKALREIRYASK